MFHILVQTVRLFQRFIRKIHLFYQPLVKDQFKDPMFFESEL